MISICRTRPTKALACTLLSNKKVNFFLNVISVTTRTRSALCVHKVN
jgi:hypothetical protein